MNHQLEEKVAMFEKLLREQKEYSIIRAMRRVKMERDEISSVVNAMRIRELKDEEIDKMVARFRAKLMKKRKANK